MTVSYRVYRFVYHYFTYYLILSLQLLQSDSMPQPTLSLRVAVLVSVYQC